jgi:hypothetical protein
MTEQSDTPLNECQQDEAIEEILSMMTSYTITVKFIFVFVEVAYLDNKVIILEIV